MQWRTRCSTLTRRVLSGKLWGARKGKRRLLELWSLSSERTVGLEGLVFRINRLLTLISRKQKSKDLSRETLEIETQRDTTDLESPVELHSCETTTRTLHKSKPYSLEQTHRSSPWKKAVLIWVSKGWTSSRWAKVRARVLWTKTSHFRTWINLRQLPLLRRVRSTKALRLLILNILLSWTRLAWISVGLGTHIRK